MSDNQYEEALAKILTIGWDRKDRTGTGTRSLFGIDLRYDLSKGFPLITTKKVFTKGIIHELLWMISGDTNIKYLNDNGVHIWDEWRKPYSENRPMTLVQRRQPSPNSEYLGNFSYSGINAPLNSIDGRLASAWVKMMRRCYDSGHHRYSLYGAKGVTVHPKWHNVKTFVHDVKNLPHWSYKKQNWNGFELDKDYYGSGQYGPDTSVWLSTEENNFYTSASNPITVTRADGTQQHFLTQAMAAEGVGMPTSTMSRFLREGAPTMLKGNNKQYLGWEFSKTVYPENVLARLALIDSGDLGPVYGSQWRKWQGVDSNGRHIWVDQLQKAIDTIKSDPDSRRIIVNSWNVAELDEMALPPCHLMYQFYVADGRLSCKLTQRSADMFLGVPFNIASYALLTHMVADVTGLEVGDLIWSGGDCHIYHNHMTQVLTQIDREPFEFPELELTHRDNIDDFVYEDVKIVNYQSHPSIKGDVAV